MYRAYGLNIESDIDLPQLLMTDELTVDLKIIKGEMPYFIIEKTKGYEYLINNREYAYIKLDDTGEFYIENGNKIIINVFEGAEELHIQSRILGMIMGYVFYQRKILSFHGGAVLINNKAVIISGDSGAGKSSLITKLLEDNAVKFMADDTVRITEEEGYKIYSSFPQQKLCEDTAENFGYNKESMILLNEERRKYALNRKEDFNDNKADLKLIAVIEPYDGEFLVEELKGMDKVNVILKNLYPTYIYDVIGMPPEEFKNCLNLANKVNIIRIKRPYGVDLLKRMEDVIYEYIR